MAKAAHELLADALEAASKVAVDHIVNSAQLRKQHKTRLIKAGFLKPIIRGWYLLDADLSAEETGDSVLWHECYWAFVAQYLSHHLGEDYIVSAEQSLDIHTGNNQLPAQLLIGNTAKQNRIVKLPRSLDLSLFSAQSLPAEVAYHAGVRLYSLEGALVRVGPAYYRRQPQEVALALKSANPTALLAQLLASGNQQSAGRLAGASRAFNQPALADELLSGMRTAGFEVSEANPFESSVPDICVLRPGSPHAARIELLWETLREQLIPLARPPTNPPADIDTALRALEERYVHDAYHSLSIEGYRVTPALIERVRQGDWDPEGNEADKQQRDAMAARGYWNAHLLVKKAIVRMSSEGVGATALKSDVSAWFRALFGPMVQSGMLNPVDLAGYRNRPVFIRGSRHTPLPSDSLLDAMETLFLLIERESHPLVAAMLGHFFIGYIHPFPDGNGRCARFLMNALLVAAGYPWVIVRLETRPEYMAALEALSIDQQAEPFAQLILEAMDYRWEN
jgi:hypothetical protein